MIDRRTLIGAAASLTAAPLIAQARPSRSIRFPKGFLWGASTSGHQIEGNNVNSDAWLMENVKPTIYAEPSGDAANSFRLWPQDLDIVKQLGLNSYRFSLEWSRIEPVRGHFSLAMLDHYKQMIEGCHRRNLLPLVTFNHFTIPRWAAAQGGWTNPELVKSFGEFCDKAARHLADGIGFAMTLNEPNLIMVVRNAIPPKAYEGYKVLIEKMAAAAARSSGSERFVSGSTLAIDDLAALQRNLLAAHATGKSAIKAVRGNLPVGVTLAIPDDQPLGANSIRDAIRAQTYGAWLEAARADDFVGVQNYERMFWDDKGPVALQGDGDRNAAGTEVVPASLANAVRYAHSVSRVPVIVTEHGVNSQDDAVRARLIPAALSELKKVIDEGVPVAGYLHWSLLDNFEWMFGYKYQYGLVAVDRTSFKRTIKPSAAILGDIARRNALR